MKTYNNISSIKQKISQKYSHSPCKYCPIYWENNEYALQKCILKMDKNELLELMKEQKNE